jgi:UrcA family protein
MLKISLIAAAALCAAVSAPAFAQVQAQDADVLQRHVSYADLDLSSPAGIATFNQRIEAAVVRVCPGPDGVDLKAWRKTQTCRSNARLEIEPVRQALLASAQAQKAGKSVVLAAK